MPMRVAFKVYGPNSDYVPEDWPSQIVEIGEAQLLEDVVVDVSGWVEMSHADYTAYRSDRQGAYDTLQGLKPPPPEPVVPPIKVDIDVPKSPHGNPVFAPTFLSASEQARLEGYELACEPGETAILDVAVTTQMLVQGGQFWSMNCQRGDIANFSVVDKNDILGLHTAYGIPLGTPIELVKYIKNYRFPTRDFMSEDIIMPTVAPIAPGLFLRTVYEAVAGGTTRYTGILYRWYIGGA